MQLTGQGVHIDVPMMGTSLAIAALQTSEYFGVNKDPVKLGSAHPRNAPYQAFKASDDYLVMAAVPKPCGKVSAEYYKVIASCKMNALVQPHCVQKIKLL